MAYQGPAYGLSRDCMLKAQAKFDLKQALVALDWIRDVTKLNLDPRNHDGGVKDQFDFADVLKDGTALCTLINKLLPGAVPKINTMKAPFKERENLEMFLKGCEAYGLKRHDLFQVNDLYERKNLYTVVNCIFALGGMAKKKGYEGPTIGVKVADENKRLFTKEMLEMGKTIIGLQSGSNQGASQRGMTPYGAPRQILPDGR
ncbi:muscle-specific protein 20-like [Stegodyphus dumicola]|uniref:muscle-specific protein 20-like n=1 Tax=Stegodyphus dumicola TaxID=202533 RepID=UPI0015AA874C|nr:muscle-specific protein 20-like [Stegodyphus dumicola]